MERPVRTLSDSELIALEAEITELWGHVNAAECRFLELVAAYDRAEGHHRHGLPTCAQWLNWQCGIGAVAARERVRAARALEQLPAIRAAFGRGEISYSKVRAITRVATPENELRLLDIAIYGTAQHVERLVRKYRRVRRVQDAAYAQAQHCERYLHICCDGDGSMILRAKLPAEVGALVRKSIQAAIDVAERAAKETAARGAQQATPPDEIKTQSNVSAETSACDAGGASRPRAAPQAAACGEARGETIAARRADALALMARHFLGCEAVDCASAAERYQVVVHIDQALLAHDDDARAHAHAEGGTGNPLAEVKPRCCEIEDGATLAADTARRLGCDGALVGLVESAAGEPLNVGRRTRAIPPALKRALKARDGGCRFPGCTHTLFTEGHHVEHWADGGETKLGNLITLCTFHHRLVHEGGYGLVVTDDGVFVFTRPDGARIAGAGRLDRHLDAYPDSAAGQQERQAPLPLAALSRERGLAIDPTTARCRWDGEPMDYDIAIEGLVWEDYPNEHPTYRPPGRGLATLPERTDADGEWLPAPMS